MSDAWQHAHEANARSRPATGDNGAAMHEAMREIDRAPTHYRTNVETAAIPPDAIILYGVEAERYKHLQDAARAATEATRAMKSTSEALRDAFQQFCAGVAPSKEP